MKTLTFCCWVYKEAPTLFAVDVPSSKALPSLQEAITKKRSDLRHVEPGKLNLYTIDSPAGGIQADIFQQWNIQDHEPLPPLCSLSSPALSNKVIVVPVLTLNCWISGQATLSVKISPMQSISALKHAIWSMKPSFRDVDADDLHLYKVPDVIFAEIEPYRRAVRPSDALVGFDPLSHWFPDYPPKDRVHIVVDVPSPHLVPQKRPLEDELPHPSDYSFDSMTPSTMQHANYGKLQRNHKQRLLDRRWPPHFDDPRPDDDVPPISLVYEPYGEFLDIYLSQGDLGGKFLVCARDQVELFAMAMGQVYKSKDERREAGLKALNSIFEATLGQYALRIRAGRTGSLECDGFETGRQDQPICVVEFKNELESNSIPVIELLRYYHELVKRVWDNDFATVSRSKLPVLGVTIIGPEITFYAIVYLQRWHYTPLTHGISCVDGAVGGHARQQLHRAFAAACTLLRCIIDDVRTPAPQRIQNRNFPYITELPSLDDTLAPVKFQITGKFSSAPYQQVYHAISTDQRKLVIKFAYNYSVELHKFCADRKRAPELRGFSKLPGNIFGIAMDLVEGAAHLCSGSVDEREKWRKQLTELVKEFHAEGFVHGDLRFPNIIRDAKNDIVLLDYDWGGKEGEACFPFGSLNPELTVGWGERTDLKITKGDDERVLATTLRNIGGGEFKKLYL